MKPFFKSIVSVTLLIFISSCSSDPAEESIPCVPIACMNGAKSTPDCGCDCLEGYTGINCSSQIKPSLVKISKIRVIKFPDTNNGNWWDILPNSDADIYVTLQDNSLVTIYNHPTYYQNAIGTGAYYYDFTPSTPIIISNTYGNLKMNLYDFEDIGSDTLMESSLFKSYDSTGGFPTTKTITNTSGTFSFELTLSYVW